MFINFLLAIVIVYVVSATKHKKNVDFVETGPTAIVSQVCTLNSVWTVAGSGAGAQTNGQLSSTNLAADGVGLSANVFFPVGIFFNPNGLEYYVSDFDPNYKSFSEIRKIQTNGGTTVSIPGDSGSSSNLPTSGAVTTIGKSNDFSIFLLNIFFRWTWTLCLNNFYIYTISLEFCTSICLELCN